HVSQSNPFGGAALSFGRSVTATTSRCFLASSALIVIYRRKISCAHLTHGRCTRSLSFQFFLVERRVERGFAVVQADLVGPHSPREAGGQHGNDRTRFARGELPALVL